MSKQFIERRIVIGLITSDKFLREIEQFYSSDYLKDSTAQTLAKWCLRHYKKHSEAPKENIQLIFDQHKRRKKLGDDQLEDIEDILDGLSDEYQSQDINEKVLVDETLEYFEENRIINLAEDIKYEAERGRLDEANNLLVESRKIQKTITENCDFFLEDRNRTKEIFENTAQPIIEYPGRLGAILNRHLVRGGFVGLLGPEKTGKTWWCLDIAFQALKTGRKVAFFAAGDMNREEMELRKYIYMAKKSNEKEYCGDLLIPIVDCFRNQNNTCEDAKGCNPITLDKIPKRKEMAQIYLDAYEIHKDDHEVCTDCIGTKKFIGSPWFKTKEKEEPLTWKEAYKIEKRFKRRLRGAGIMFADYPADTLSPSMIDNQLSIWNDSGFTADIVIVDYPDIMTCDDEDRKFDFRQRENMKWKKLRGLWHKWNCLGVCPTQADANSYEKEWIDLSNYSEDKRKYSHTTAFFGLNQTDNEATLGLFRINQLIVRSGKRGNFYATICQRLEIGRPFLGSY